jgi:endo-1,4-beta-D-glucanase Y
LARSFRVNGGKPQQQHIAFLGSISIDGSDRLRFWLQLTMKLDRLSERLSSADRAKILAAITAKLGPPPTRAELAAFRPSGFLMYLY